MTAKPLPYSEDAEQAVLSAMLVDADTAARGFVALTAEMFYVERHRRIFTAMGALAARGDIIDPLTLADQLDATGELAGAGGKDYLGFLVDVVPTAANVEYHAGIVRKAYDRRELAKRLQEATAAVLDGATEPATVAAELAGALVDVAVERGRRGFAPIHEGLVEVLQGIEDRGAGRVTPGVRTGFREIDDAIGGFRGGDLIILAGVPGSGKTAAGLNILLNAACNGDEGAMVSAEMTGTELKERLLGNMALVDSHTLRTGRLGPDEWKRVAEAAQHLKALPLHVDDTPRPSIKDIAARLRYLKTKHPGLKLVVVDFIQLLRTEGDNIALALTEITYDLKGLAKELDLAIIATCQVDAATVEKSEDKRPRLHHLRWSQGMREGADFVALCFRPSMYEEPDPFRYRADTMEVDFEKCRGLPPFKATLKWLGKYMRMENLAA